MGLPSKVLVHALSPDHAVSIVQDIGYAVAVFEFDRVVYGLPDGWQLYEVSLIPADYDGRDGSLEISDEEQEELIAHDRVFRQERQRLEDYDAGIIHDDDH
jgi:hypothetical protein